MPFAPPANPVKLPDCQLNWDVASLALDHIRFSLVMDRSGPLTQSSTYQCNGGHVWLIFWGAGLVTTTFSFNGIDLFVNSTLVAQSYVGFNEPNSHRATIPAVWDAGVRSDLLTLDLRAGTPAAVTFQTDANDRFRLVALEVPA